jgi:hypothetical protein
LSVSSFWIVSGPLLVKLRSSSSVNFCESFASAPRAVGVLVLNLVMGARREVVPRASHVGV